MTSEPHNLSLQHGAALSGMSHVELWIRQIEVGGSAGALEVEAYTLGVLQPDTEQHNIIAQAINEHFMDQGGNHPVAYDDSTTDTPN